MAKICLKCGREFSDDCNVCSNCGLPLPEAKGVHDKQVKICPYCGREIPAEMNFCIFCMHTLNTRTEPADFAEIPHSTRKVFKRRTVILTISVLCIIIVGAVFLTNGLIPSMNRSSQLQNSASIVTANKGTATLASTDSDTNSLESSSDISNNQESKISSSSGHNSSVEQVTSQTSFDGTSESEQNDDIPNSQHGLLSALQKSASSLSDYDVYNYKDMSFKDETNSYTSHLTPLGSECSCTLTYTSNAGQININVTSPNQVEYHTAVEFMEVAFKSFTQNYSDNTMWQNFFTLNGFTDVNSNSSYKQDGEDGYICKLTYNSTASGYQWSFKANKS